MKLKNFFLYIFILAFVSTPTQSFAAALQPFGGRIITAPTPGVTCPAGKEGSPFTVNDLRTPVPTPFLMVGDYHPTSMGFKLTPGAWILGLYKPVPIPECVTETVPPATVQGFRTFLHGTSASQGSLGN